MRKLATVVAAALFAVAPAVVAQEAGSPVYGEDRMSGEVEADVDVKADIDVNEGELDTKAEASVETEGTLGADSDVGGEPEELPATASPLALIGLGGLASLGGAAVARATRKRRS
jgi:hypothetical protein